MGSQEFLKYKKIYKDVSKQIKKPDIIIFLRSSLNTNIQRIKRRQRDCEKEIDSTYLSNLHDKYQDFLSYLKKNF